MKRERWEWKTLIQETNHPWALMGQRSRRDELVRVKFRSTLQKEVREKIGSESDNCQLLSPNHKSPESFQQLHLDFPSSGPEIIMADKKQSHFNEENSYGQETGSLRMFNRITS